jgi:hypothetical protein
MESKRESLILNTPVIFHFIVRRKSPARSVPINFYTTTVGELSGAKIEVASAADRRRESPLLAHNSLLIRNRLRGGLVP